MYFSRKNILTKGRRPLYAASRVLNASSASASSVVARCWVHSTSKTSALIRTVRNRAYSSRAGSGADPNLQTPGGVGLPLYSTLFAHSSSHSLISLGRETYQSLDGNTYQMVPAPAGRRSTTPGGYSIQEESKEHK